MKYTIIAVCAAMCFAACNGEATTENTETTIEAVTENTNAEMDPVCEMVKDETWTAYSVSESDTTWFCSETCQTAYHANPAKYDAKS